MTNADRKRLEKFLARQKQQQEMRQGLAMVVREQNTLKEESKELGAGGQQEPKKFLSKRERLQKREEDKRKRIQQEKDSTLMGRALGNLIAKFNVE